MTYLQGKGVLLEHPVYFVPYGKCDDLLLLLLLLKNEIFGRIKKKKIKNRIYHSMIVTIFTYQDTFFCILIIVFLSIPICCLVFVAINEI
jgi:hypothetical protein